MTTLTRSSYIFLLVLLALAGWLHLTTILITVLFACFALNLLSFKRSKWLAVGLFTVLVAVIFYGFAFFIKHAFVALPKIAEQSIPSIIEYAAEHGLHLPFDDLESLKVVALDALTNKLGYFGNFAKVATKEFAFLVIGIVVAVSLFFNSRLDLERDHHRVKNNLYSLFTDEIAARFRSFFHSFEVVMGAQIIISAINTALTSIFIAAVELPYPIVVIVVTFLCGLLPIIGNIISNTVIVSIAFTISPKLALVALIFLVVLHKLEYFLNSQIIGQRIKNPVWLTLLALILGERLMGIPGMILAPVILYFLKVEAAKIKIDETPAAPAPAELIGVQTAALEPKTRD